jgi:hypothetical protein
MIGRRNCFPPGPGGKLIFFHLLPSVAGLFSASNSNSTFSLYPDRWLAGRLLEKRRELRLGGIFAQLGVTQEVVI